MTVKLSRIVVGTDMSSRSDRAVARAFQLGTSLAVPVQVLMVLDDAMPEDLLAPLHAKAKAQLKAFCDDLAGSHVYQLNVQTGDPTEELLKAAEPADETLLVLGPHRPRPFLDGLRETTMQRVARRTGAAVLLVKEPVTGAYENILSAVDFGPVSTHALQLGAKLAPRAHLTALHAIHVPYSGMLETTGSVQADLTCSFEADAKSLNSKWRESEKLPPSLAAETVMKLNSPFGLLHDMTRDGSFDLVTAGAHGRVGAARALLGSVASDLMRAPPCDVLIAR